MTEEDAEARQKVQDLNKTMAQMRELLQWFGDKDLCWECGEKLAQEDEYTFYCPCWKNPHIRMSKG